ncbi:hypothetical protein BuS5_03195 [Desulfosarcina sp. BuS5]|uniref:transposase n=1 Tax=Desulfosarcina sp. BuS5 TaxID=933262 RepID=UPI000ACC5531|nr:transposase [Desulfosarcina sp. BuS5]WDN90224.1 hypothetical protein BuS5_03195 [Desulfosarcina sp. BuS5]
MSNYCVMICDHYKAYYKEELLMNEITTLLTCMHPLLDANTYRHFLIISQALLMMTGRITMLSISRWTEKGGSYRTVQRFFSKNIPLSNNHVLANSNNARIGNPILQPGPYDGGRYPRDLIARLSRYVSIRFGGSSNYVDAAIAEGQFHDLDRQIYWIGYVKGVRAVRVGEIVQKTGRTTNYTTGRVTAINATVNVNYGGSRVARMVRQIITTNMSAGGDSGSLLCDLNENAVGLLFAGSSRVTIHNDIRYVQRLLGIRVV